MLLKYLLRVALSYGVMSLGFAANDDPCRGPGELLNYTHRGSVADGPCAVPFKTAMLEAGYLYTQDTQLANAAVFNQNFPQLALTLGLPAKSQIVLYAPTYNQQTRFPFSGYNAFQLGIKHVFIANQKWILTAGTVITPPGGSVGFGSREVSAVANGIVNYTIDEYFSFLFQLGVSTTSLPALAGNARYQSVDPDFVFTYAPIKQLNIYGEIYGQSKTGPDQGSGFNTDWGVIYLIRPTIALDLEVGYPLSGNLDGKYLGFGLTMWFT